ncbi:hypothetical protein BJY52DRAFT_1273605, partial [Lactarius psammicola]
DVLLKVFNYYRLDDKNTWNVRLGWCKLSHVCRRWRQLMYSSAFHLGMHILCTYGTPIVDTLDHLPPLPLFVNYPNTNMTMSWQDKLGLYHALELRDRVRRIDLHLPPSILHKFLMPMDEPFPILEHLSLSVTVDEVTTRALPKTFLAPNLRHLALVGIRLPKRLRLLSSTAFLVSLVLGNIRVSGFFLPRLLAARLQSLPQLEELSIGFSVPIPRPSAERELLGKKRTPVMLPNLRNLRFKGVSAYLECLVAQIRAPFLERLDITLFNQIALTLPSLFHIMERIKPDTAEVNFECGAVSIIMDDSTRLHERSILRVMCKPLDWQIDSAAQICSTLTPVLSGVEKLTLDFHEELMPTEWQNGEIDGTTWHELLRSFIRVKELRICDSLSEELSGALELDEIGSDLGFLPSLQELTCDFENEDRLFGSFIDSRCVAGRPVHASFVSSETPRPHTFTHLPLPPPSLNFPLS